MTQRRQWLQAACALSVLPSLALAEDDSEARSAISLVLAGKHRSEAFAARDRWRNPLQTLLFLGLKPAQTVIEMSPGSGWYTEVLAPVLRERGKLFAALYDPDSHSYYRRAWTAFGAKLAREPQLYDQVTVGLMPKGGRFSDIDPPGGVDLILTFRNVHNWVDDGSFDDMLGACHAALKPGGVLGVIDHRAVPGASLAKMKKSGYVTEAYMEERAQAAGFKLAARSEINANPRDTKDHPQGVWSLPPTLRGKDVNRDHFLAIGESDRFTHRYAKSGA